VFRTDALAIVESHRAAGDHLVLLSASPDLYVPSIGAHLRFERTLCTELKWDGDRLNGSLRTRIAAAPKRCAAWSGCASSIPVPRSSLTATAIPICRTSSGPIAPSWSTPTGEPGGGLPGRGSPRPTGDDPAVPDLKQNGPLPVS